MDHSECVQVDAFTRTDVHHTHEGQAGWWLFPSEVPAGWRPQDDGEGQ